MQLQKDLFIDMLNIDSTSGSERTLADMLAGRLCSPRCRLEVSEAADGEPVNLLFSWGRPKILYCTHLDTVPPYIAPTIDGDIIRGRGTCDAKGQIFAMYSACMQLEAEGADDFGLLLLYGEETGSFGAKAFRECPGVPYVVVGEPTGNKMVSASKGTKAFEVTVRGKSFHSGYPQHGRSAVDMFVDMMLRLRQIDFPLDPVLGQTTYNVGRLRSDNPQNILSPLLTCRVYFRTTFASDEMVSRVMADFNTPDIEVRALGGDTPMRYFTLPGFDTTTVSFGSDAPQLTNCTRRMLCGPGSILVAHTPDECITWPEITEAVQNYVRIYKQLEREGCFSC